MHGIDRLVIFAIALGALWLILCVAVELPARAKQIGNIVLVAIIAIVAVKVLMSFV